MLRNLKDLSEKMDNPLFKNFIDARKDLLREVSRELLGPGSEGVDIAGETEVISDNPVNRYTVGILFAQKLSIDDEQNIYDENAASVPSAGDDALDAHVSLANQMCPSALGVSFCVQDDVGSLNVEVSAGQYKKIDKKNLSLKVSLEKLPDGVVDSAVFLEKLSYADGYLTLRSELSSDDRDSLLKLSEDVDFKKSIWRLHSLVNYGWQRSPLRKEVAIVIDSKAAVEVQIIEGLKLYAVSRDDPKKARRFVTVSLVNTNSEKNQQGSEAAFFQACLRITSVDSAHIFLEYAEDFKYVKDPELESNRLLYRNYREYAIGHGCAAEWGVPDNNGCVAVISTTFLPSYENPGMDFNLSTTDASIADALSMYHLGDFKAKDKRQILGNLESFCELYKHWLGQQQSEVSGLPDDLHSVARHNLSLCDEVYKRMKRGLELLSGNLVIWEAFRLANQAMFIQQVRTGLQKEKGVLDSLNYELYSKEKKWRPFQLAFLLMSITSISNHQDPERDLVDLIWFPTGGGKTEAYLGLAAFTIFLRRMKAPDAGGGTAIIMRYTLRLLTAQQFQRASALICACEFIRRSRKDLGSESIDIGLWIGGDSTPNKTDEALKNLKELQSRKLDLNPFQILTCPWCGMSLEKKNHSGAWGYKEGRPKRLIIFCPNRGCSFYEELPIKVVDEEIYCSPPTFLFSTVDKFAQMPWRADVGRLFGLDEGSLKDRLAPELIIQDELHLISGPLGTVVGLYELAVDNLCSAKGVRPKIIASTATIRSASDQCRALYAREMRLFPPPATSIDDSFFARTIPISQHFGRLYVGVMSAGKTQVTSEVRLVSAAVQAAGDILCEDEVRDKYWTLVTYFNSLRELGQCVTLVNDDVKDHIRSIAMRRGIEPRKNYEPDELTSRKPAAEIPKILNKINIPYPNKEAVDILLASNMLATGVDIDRLGLMIVAGQPKTTAEYIQATSRIGRKYPGLVFILYDGAKSRDRSHFEHFKSYHQSFYKYVEPTSVTPFSGPARDKALHAIIIALMRHLLGYVKNDSVRVHMTDEHVKKIKNILLERVAIVDERERHDLERDIDQVLLDLSALVQNHPNLVFGTMRHPSQKRVENEIPVMFQAGQESDGRWPTMNSLREVDDQCGIQIIR